MVGSGDDDEVDSGWEPEAAGQAPSEDDSPEITIEEIDAIPSSAAPRPVVPLSLPASPPASIPAPLSIGRRNTPRVMDAVVQARELDHTAAKQMAMRRTPVRIPSAAKKSAPPEPTSSVPPAPVPGSKGNSTALRFAEPPRATRKLDRKATLRLSPATHKLAFDLAAADDPVVEPPDDVISLAIDTPGAQSSKPPGAGDDFDDLPIDAVLDSHRAAPSNSILATRKRLADLADAIEQRERGLEAPLGFKPGSASSSPPRIDELGTELPLSEPISLADADIASVPPPSPPPPRGRGPLAGGGPIDLEADKLLDALLPQGALLPQSPLLPDATRLPEGGATTEPPAPTQPSLADALPPELEGRLEAARLRFERGDFAGALLRVEPLAEEHPGCTEAVVLLGACRDSVKRTYLEKLGSESSVPRVIMPQTEIQALALDHRSGFLISLVDGTASIEEILDVSGMPPLEALRLLFELQQESVIESVAVPRGEGSRPRRPAG